LTDKLRHVSTAGSISEIYTIAAINEQERISNKMKIKMKIENEIFCTVVFASPGI